MSNPFEAEDRPYQVLVNDEEQYSLWPDWLDVPSGWTKVLGPASRTECLAHVERTWRDMRPRSLREHMDANDRARG